MTKIVREITLGTLVTVAVTIATTVGAITVSIKNFEADVTITLRDDTFRWQDHERRLAAVELQLQTQKLKR